MWLMAAVLAASAVPSAPAIPPAQAAIETARRLLAEGRSAEAIAAFRQAIALDPANAAAHNALGSLLNSAGHYAEALPHAEAAARLEPGNARYRYNRGVVRAEHGRFAEAIADFDHALAAHPELAYAWLERGAARLSLGDGAGAERDWAEAGKRDPQLVWVEWYRATGAFVAGRYADAAAGFDRVAAAEPGFAPAPLWRTIAHGRAGTPIAAAAAGTEWPAPVLDFARGAITAERLLAIAGEDRASGDRRRIGEALFFLGQLALIAGRDGAAVGYFRRALEIVAPRHVWKISAVRELRLLEPKARSR